MSEPLRVAVLGLSHDHVWWNIPGLLKSPDIRVVAAADPHPPLLDKFLTEVPDGAIFAEPEACLDAVAPDIALCCDSNRRNVELVELAAGRGCHCVVEKPMASTLAGADRMLAAADAAGVELIINWPVCWDPAWWHAGRLALSGELGPIWQCRYHAAHNGPREVGCSEYFCAWLYDLEANGPGALMDYCCYGAALNAWLLGAPRLVTGFMGRLLKTEPMPADNAVLLLDYPGAIGLLEASWTQLGDVPRKGATINCRDGCIEPLGGQLRVTSAAHPGGQLLPAEAPSAHLTSLGHYTTALIRGECGPEGVLDARVARLAQAILEAGWEAAVNGRSTAPR